MTPQAIFAVVVALSVIVLAVAYVSMLSRQAKRSIMRIVPPVTDTKVKAMLAQAAPGSLASKRIYRECYLQTAHWRKFRADAWSHYNGKCAECGGHTKLHECNIHHLRYYDDHGSILFRERYSDVEVVHAGRCHVKADRRRHGQTH